MVSIKKIRIALMGTRGIPAAYGGFETFAEELSKRLAARGHDVTVYQRHEWRQGLCAKNESSIGLVQRRSTATIMHKYAETPLSSLSSFLDVLFKPSYDAILLCNAANSPFAFFAKLRGVPLAINVDGVERKRTKWNGAGKLWYRLGEMTSVWFANTIVADAEVIAEYYRERFNIEPAIIAYGAEPKPLPSGSILKQFGLNAGEYVLFVSRFEPENNPLGVVQAYVKSGITAPLVMVGDAPYADAYKAQVRAAANDRVIFTGYQFGDAYRELRSNCLCYIQATEVGGTHPALVEAMAYGNAIIANDVPEHWEVLGDAGIYYPKNDFDALSEQLKALCSDATRRSALCVAARDRARLRYSWDVVTDKYEQLLLKLCAH